MNTVSNMPAIPPSEFSTIGLDASNFKKAGVDEWHGPCVFCGGRDRFIIYTDRDYPSWNWFCRQCHPESAWIDEINPMLKEPLSPEKAEQIARRTEARLEKAIQDAQDALTELKRARSWERYHEQLTDDARQRWESWGIPEFWQEFYKLGFDPDRTIWTGTGEWHTPTMTIPVFEAKTWECLNVRHRLLKPPQPGDKYRPERSGLPASLFVAYPDEPVYGKTLLVEGEKKAMVSFITADDPFMQAVGIPGKNPSDELLTQLDDCDPVYICMDPDARCEAVKLARKLGADRTRLIELPDKIDDLIITHQLDKPWMAGVMRQAVKVR